MTKPADHQDVASALLHFADALAHERLLDDTRRLETTVRGPCSLEPLRRAEAAFDTAWPGPGRPSHEFVWSLLAGDPQTAISVRAFDSHGKLLLGRQFAMGALNDVAA